MKKQKKENALTLMELLVVAIVITVITAFIIPNYNAAVQRGYEKDAVLNLRAMAAAEKIYRAVNGSYWPEVISTEYIAAINNNLRLNIVENSIEYRCHYSLLWGGLWYCEAAYPDFASIQWRLAVHNINDFGTVTCQTAPCPQCDGGGCPY